MNEIRESDVLKFFLFIYIISENVSENVSENALETKKQIRLTHVYFDRKYSNP